MREMPLMPRDVSSLNGIRLPSMRRSSMPSMSSSTRPYEALYQNAISRTGRSRMTRTMGNNSTTYGAVVQRSQSSDSPSSAGSLPPIAKTNKQVRKQNSFGMGHAQLQQIHNFNYQSPRPVFDAKNDPERIKQRHITLSCFIFVHTL
jgi:hypothetical protein